MPTSERSLRITDAYAAQLRRLRDTVTGLIGDRWRAMDSDDLVASFRRWLPAALALVTLGQRDAVRLSDAYLSSFLSSELGVAVGPKGLDPDAYAGHTRDGRHLREVFVLPLVSVKLALGQANTMGTALNMGLARAVRATRTEVTEAGRGALSDAMASDERVVGYRRVVHSRKPCGACLALAGKRMKDTDGLLMHASCSCQAEPVVEGVKERATRPDGKAMFDAMTPGEQDAMFAGRGGADKADLIRSGAKSLDDLVTVHESPAFGTQIFETPLEQLV